MNIIIIFTFFVYNNFPSFFFVFGLPWTNTPLFPLLVQCRYIIFSVSFFFNIQLYNFLYPKNI